MGRSLMSSRNPRCERCLCAPRWCICAGQRIVESPLAVDLLMHRREFHRPTSTGRLVHRVMAGSRLHLYRQETPPLREAVARPDRELWILHPRGEAVPAGADPAGLQVLLLDGSWGEAAGMMRAVAGWGRLIRLPDAGRSRNGLRRQELAGKYSTAESLLFLLEALGLPTAELRGQFELHVYAGLRTRGAVDLAEAFLAGSALRESFPELLAEMNRRRPAI